MHTCPESGINSDLATDLEENFTWIPPLTVFKGASEALKDPESTSLDSLEKAFQNFEEELQQRDRDQP